MEQASPSTILITGIMASGKSTVAQSVAERLPKSVHLRGDLFRRMIVNGREEMNSPLSDAAVSQLHLRYQLAAQAANSYCAAGLTVVYQDVIIGAILQDVVLMHQQWPLYVVVLCPSPEIAMERDAHRHKQVYQSWTPNELDLALRYDTPQFGLWLDTSAMTVEETVDAIFNGLEAARISL